MFNISFKMIKIWLFWEYFKYKHKERVIKMIKKEVTLYDKLFPSTPGFDGLEYKGEIRQMIKINDYCYIKYFKGSFYIKSGTKNYATSMETARLEEYLNELGASLFDFYSRNLINENQQTYGRYGGNFNG